MPFLILTSLIVVIVAMTKHLIYMKEAQINNEQ